MATGFMAQMLDELMGKDRDLLPDEASRHQTFDDPDICKYYLCGFCPHDLFTNTKTDLGPCTGAHDDALVEAYKRSSKFKKMGYEEDFLRYLQQIKNDCEKRIKRANQRLSQAPNQNLGNPRTSSLQIIENKINTLLEKVESLGNEGKVEEAQSIMKQIDQLRRDKENLQSHIGADNPNEKQMEVCTICGAFLIVGDAPSRVDDHLKGKQHTGFAKVRSAIAQLREELYNIRDDESISNPTPVRNKSQSGSPVRRRRSSSDDRSRESYRKPPRESDKTEQFDYDDMLQKESERRNIYPEELPQAEKPRKHHKSRSRSRSGRRRNERRSRSRDRKRSRSGKKDDRHSSSRRRSRDRKRSRSREKKVKKESTKSSRHRESRSKSRDAKSSGTHGSKHAKNHSNREPSSVNDKTSNGPSATNESSSSNH